MTDEELKELVASLAVSKKETDKQLQETERQVQRTSEQLQKNDGKMEELHALQAKTDRHIDQMTKSIKELGKQLGGLGNKFGSFTEGMAFPSMEKLLRKKFKMDVVASNIKARRNGKKMELDVLSYSNSDLNTVIIVEVKSHLDEREWLQVQAITRDFFDFFPSHKGKKLYCIVAAVDYKEDIAREIIESGIYLAQMNDDLFALKVPRNFVPRAFE